MPRIPQKKKPEPRKRAAKKSLGARFREKKLNFRSSLTKVQEAGFTREEALIFEVARLSRARGLSEFAIKSMAEENIAFIYGPKRE